ncbi:MAG: hypothetical protein WCP45_00435 [Verrucomicrobiota bacterium]
MNACPTAADAKSSLADHVADKGAELHAKYGPHIGWSELQQVLLDRSLVRYPCEIAFTPEGLREGEFAYPHALGEKPEEGFIIRVHPVFMTELELVPYLVFYQLVAVNYGDFASTDDAEAFGAAALGLEPDVYYDTICRLADQLGECGCG